MGRILFVGNGFNQVSDGGASWNALLNKLAGVTKTQHEEDVRKAKPFTLWFEEIANKSRKKYLKMFVADSLKKTLSPNEHHSEVMALDFRHIFTTNYDYNLELATGKEWKLNLPAPEKYFSLFRRHTLDDKHLWHIHGELDNVKSIMLGHEQYSGYIHKIRNYLTTGVPTEVKDRNGKPYLSKFARKKEVMKGDVETWIDLFLEYEVHIIGFGFDYTENHLWNLITEKKRLRKERRNSIGQAVFHRCSKEKQNIADEARLSILEALGVKVVDHTATSYSEAYSNCIKSLH